MAERSGEVKAENEENGDVNVDTTALSILDDAAVPTTTMHSNPHWKRLKLSVKASNAFKRSKDGRNQNQNQKKNQQRRAKRLSIVMKAKRDSAVEQTTTVVNAAAEAGAAEKKEDDDMKMNKVSPPL